MITEIWRLKIKNMLKLPRAGHFRRLRTAGFLFLLNCRIRITSPIGDALRNLVPLLQFKKHGKHSWRSVTFSKIAG